MVFITDKDLTELLDYQLATLVKNAHPYTTTQTILQRLLDKCATTLNIDIEWYTDKNIILIHPENMIKIDLKWQSLPNNQIKYDERNVYKMLKFSDFVNIHDIQKFINILVIKNESNFLSELLAIDGFHDNIKNYIDNLKVGEKGCTHIHCIRNIYQTFQNCPVKVVYLVLLKIYINFAKDDEIQQLMKNTIDEIENELINTDVYNSFIEKITHMYLNSIYNLENTAMIKMAQLKIQKKKVNKAKKS